MIFKVDGSDRVGHQFSDFVFFLSLGISKTMRNLLFKLVSFILRRKIFKGRLERFVFSFEEYCKGAQRTFQSLMQQK